MKKHIKAIQRKVPAPRSNPAQRMAAARSQRSLKTAGQQVKDILISDHLAKERFCSALRIPLQSITSIELLFYSAGEPSLKVTFKRKDSKGRNTTVVPLRKIQDRNLAREIISWQKFILKKGRE